jgi:hypothetical protein
MFEVSLGEDGFGGRARYHLGGGARGAPSWGRCCHIAGSSPVKHEKPSLSDQFANPQKSRVPRLTLQKICL